MWRSFLLTVVVFISFSSFRTDQASTEITSATVPMHVENNRVFVDLGFRRPDGSIRVARAWVDTGGGWFAISESLAEDLGLFRKGQEIKSDVEGAVPISAPHVFLGQMPLDLSTANTYAVLGAIHVGVNAEAFLPARVLMHYDAVFDYPGEKFTLAKPGVLQPIGEKISTPIEPKSGFARIEMTVGQERLGMLLDTGAAYTMMSRELLDRWVASHPEWPTLTGAVGEANMIGNQLDTDALLLRVPEIRFGAVDVNGVGLTSRTAGIFETSMSRMMTSPIVGAVAGNILRRYRVEIDYEHGLSYLEMGKVGVQEQLDSVGIIFKVESDGSYRVVGVARKNSKEVIEGVHAGDRLLKVDSLSVTGADMALVIEALRGKPGEHRTLEIERDGKRISVDAVVQRLL